MRYNELGGKRGGGFQDIFKNNLNFEKPKKIINFSFKIIYFIYLKKSINSSLNHPFNNTPKKI